MKLTNISEELNAEFGERGTSSRNAFEDEAYAYYNAEILKQARREAHLTQSELAEKVGTSKAYISQIENGKVDPSTGFFFRILNAMGYRMEILRAL